MSDPIDPGARIGHVHLKVSDIERAVEFYSACSASRSRPSWDGAAFISAGGYHHHIGLNTWQARDGPPPPPGTTGPLPHRDPVPDAGGPGGRAEAGDRGGGPATGASDHGVSEALYLDDPDGNGVELYWDRPEEEWPRQPDGEGVEMYTRPLDLQGLLAEAGELTRSGQVEVQRLARARAPGRGRPARRGTGRPRPPAARAGARPWPETRLP